MYAIRLRSRREDADRERMTVFRAGDRVLVRGRRATFVKIWGSGAVVRFDERPDEPKVVPLRVLEPLAVEQEGQRGSPER